MAFFLGGYLVVLIGGLTEQTAWAVVLTPLVALLWAGAVVLWQYARGNTISADHLYEFRRELLLGKIPSSEIPEEYVETLRQIRREIVGEKLVLPEESELP